MFSIYWMGHIFQFNNLLEVKRNGLPLFVEKFGLWPIKDKDNKGPNSTSWETMM